MLFPSSTTQIQRYVKTALLKRTFYYVNDFPEDKVAWNECLTLMRRKSEVAIIQAVDLFHVPSVYLDIQI